MSRGVALRGASALVTGASSGLGRALALELGSRGARLAVAARRSELLDSLADEVEASGGERPAALMADLGVRGAAADLAERATAELGAVDVLVNNAGGGVGGNQWVVGDRPEAREAFEINLWSPLALTAALVPAMSERGRGAVANVTSLSQTMALWGMGHYSATKAALAQATETLRLELTGSGVGVLEVVAGPLDTAIQAETRLIPGVEAVMRRAPVGQPAELARLMAVALERGRGRIVYPRRLALAYALPTLTRRFLRREARRLRDQIDADDPRVVVSGSQGDELAREAREEWASTGL